MMTPRSIIGFFCIAALMLFKSELLRAEIRYTVSDHPWSEELGSHRAIVHVANPAGAARMRFLWRRHDPEAAQKRFLIVNATTGDTIRQILRVEVTQEVCDVAFGPVPEAGTYFFYYLSYTVQPGWGNYSKDYFPPETTPSAAWKDANHLTSPGGIASLPAASVKEIQARTAFDSFFPMEIVPTSNEKRSFLRQHVADYLLFPEDRQFPIRMKDEIPLKWLGEQGAGVFSARAMRNEYFAFQIGVYASGKELRDLTVHFSSLRDGDGHEIAAERLTCFNTGGVDPYGRTFTKNIRVNKGEVQPLWIGIDIPRSAVPGDYAGIVTIAPAGIASRSVRVKLNVVDTLLSDRGDSEPWRHSRLRWLNSTAGLDSNNVQPYTPVTKHGENRVSLLGSEITTAQDGLPTSIKAWGTEILDSPMQFIIEIDSGNVIWPQFRVTKQETRTGMTTREADAEDETIRLRVSSRIESDGYCLYTYHIEAKTDVDVRDVRLQIPLRAEIAQYMMGMGRMGSKVPERHYALWEGSHDSFWIGNTVGGISCELRGAAYTGPLLDLFNPGPPPSWWNGRKGGFLINRSGSRVTATVFSGGRHLAGGSAIDFEFALLITPVKKIDTKTQFRDRYYHGGNLVPSDDEIKAGIRIVNLHHANPANPYINYPFLAIRTLKGMVDSAHARGLRLKLYYTVRELSNHVTELWALRSLGDEIFPDGKGGGFPWLREHCVSGYVPQWYQHFEDDALGVDASILTSTGPSRWYNYYIEGLAWLIRTTGIDGLYLDDVAYDRHILKRMRKVMEAVKPGCLIDLHSNTYFSKGPATQYTEFFPYIDKLWFGEGFQYDQMPPENWLVEVSGIPFGLMGDMLEGGGNPWRGMVYGMTVRYPWVTDDVQCDPRALWAVWDGFGIIDAEMVGYWSPRPVVSTDNPDILATAYIRQGRMMIALASWSDSPADVHLDIRWNAIGFDGSRLPMHAPPIRNFQPEKYFAPGEPIYVAPKRGWILLIESPR